MELFVEPLSPPCQHTFCKECIYKHFALGGQTCPSCRAPAWKRQAAPNHMVAGLEATLLHEDEPAQKRQRSEVGI